MSGFNRAGALVMLARFSAPPPPPPPPPPPSSDAFNAASYVSSVSNARGARRRQCRIARSTSAGVATASKLTPAREATSGFIAPTATRWPRRRAHAATSSARRKFAF